MSYYKPKPIDARVFYELGRTSWEAKKLVSEAIPVWLRRFSTIYASGDCSMPRVEIWGGKELRSVVGGIDVFRYDLKDFFRYGVIFNKDHYVVTSGGILIAYGPFRDQEHWLNEVPRYLRDASILEM